MTSLDNRSCAINEPEQRVERDAVEALARVRDTRVTCVLAISLMFVFAITDIWAFPSEFIIAWAIRLIAAGGLLVVFIVANSAFFERHYAAVILATYLGIAAAVNALIFLSGPSDFSRDIYFSAFILINMGLFTWVHFTARGVVALATTIVCSYAALMILRHDSLAPQNMAIFCTQMLFIFGSALIGYMSFALRNRYLIDNARLRRALELSIWNMKNVNGVAANSKRNMTS